ncbi:ABC transporter permease [Dyella acidiphila]|uniref:ABC transporter permease n=1 Tax=Dyella acidiphila TaxID=2775866 RepID=A0ABR9G561_9GAMM|nr:ABC transporter permease [Dyella acidiphila]MBE1159195.1 ABC transporter permease [Dyella acidiphila]
MQKQIVATAVGDIVAAVRRIHLVGMLGWQDVRQRYRRSVLGPFWLTISMGVMIGTIGLVFGQIFKSPLTEFLPFLAAGMILWAFMSSIVLEGCDCFIAADSIIKQLPIPLFVHVLRMVWRNTLILAHNIVIFPLVLLAVGRPIGWLALLAIPGFLLAVANLTWVALLLGVLCSRYRDLSQIVASLLQVLFYLTPIMWMPSSISRHAGSYLLDLNPLYHLLSIVRTPLLNQLPSQADWGVSLGLCVVGWIAALALYGRYKRRVAYWL